MKLGESIGVITDLVPVAVMAIIGYLLYQVYQKNCFLGIGGACAPGGAAGIARDITKDVISVIPVGTPDEKTRVSRCLTEHNPLFDIIGYYKCLTEQAPAPNIPPYVPKMTDYSGLTIAAPSQIQAVAEATFGLPSTSRTRIASEAVLSRVGQPGYITTYTKGSGGGGGITVSNVPEGKYRSTGGRVVPSYVPGGAPVPYTG